MDFHDILIILLMFAAPILSAVADKKKKAKKKAEQATRRQYGNPNPFGPHSPFTWADTEPVKDDPEPPKTVEFDPKAEGTKVFEADSVTVKPEPEEKSSEREAIDVNKLIIYDAIMNPKFKEYEV